MKLLDEHECVETSLIYEEAIRVARGATCKKSMRGVVFVRDGAIIGRGCNGPPAGYCCDGAVCRAQCRDVSIHAEKRAMFDAMHHGQSLVGARGYHVKLVDGVAVASSVPSCEQCSKDMLDAGIAEFVLQSTEGYVCYTLDEFHRLTLQHVHGESFVETFRNH